MSLLSEPGLSNLDCNLEVQDDIITHIQLWRQHVADFYEMALLYAPVSLVYCENTNYIIIPFDVYILHPIGRRSPMARPHRRPHRGP